MIPLHKILAIDIGAGTQDILIYDDELIPENYISLVLPAPSRWFAEKIDHASRDLFIDGDPIGGGALPSRLKKHLEKGFRVMMTEDAAFTVRNSLEEVADYGIEICSGEPDEGFQGTRLRFQEINLPLLKNFLARYGEECNGDLVGIAVQDHGIPSGGLSNREHRFKVIAQHLQQNNRPESFVYACEEIPVSFKRMRAVAQTAKRQLECKVVVMDTAFAAILGCMEESHSTLFINVGNNHTLVASIAEGRIEGLMEHHTSSLSAEKLDALLARFMRGDITSEEVLDDGGHGVIMMSSGLSAQKEIVVTGPHRCLLQHSRHKVRFAAPHGNMMLTGPFGLVKGAQLKYSESG